MVQRQNQNDSDILDPNDVTNLRSGIFNSDSCFIFDVETLIAHFAKRCQISRWSYASHWYIIVEFCFGSLVFLNFGEARKWRLIPKLSRKLNEYLKLGKN